jgi:hypothetical protein
MSADLVHELLHAVATPVHVGDEVVVELFGVAPVALNRLLENEVAEEIDESFYVFS